MTLIIVTSRRCLTTFTRLLIVWWGVLCLVGVYFYVDIPLPIGWGSTYCFTEVCFGVDARLLHVTPITKGSPAQIFLGGMFIVHQGIGFDFCYDLDLCSQGQAVRAFFIGMGFFLGMGFDLLLHIYCVVIFGDLGHKAPELSAEFGSYLPETLEQC